MVEHLSSKCEALSSNSSAAKKEKKKKKSPDKQKRLKQEDCKFEASLEVCFINFTWNSS
jgi:hypothetical protein